MYKFLEVDMKNIDEEKYNAFEMKTVYTTVEWLNFIERTHRNTKIKIIEIYENEQFLGYFTGGLVTVAGFIKILGSPFNGWNTHFMGFDIYDREKAIDILPYVIKYFSKKYHCIYLQICNEYFDNEVLNKNKIRYQKIESFKTDLTLSEEEIYAGFHRDVKAKIRKFNKTGCHIESDCSQEYVDIYWKQLVESFKNRGLSPSYDKKRIEVMVEELNKKNMIHCLRVINPEGVCIASFLSIGFGNITIVIGNPSYIRYRNEYKPNEVLVWQTIKYWKNKGVKIFDYGGGGDWKLKFGCSPTSYFMAHYSNIPGLFWLKDFAAKMFWHINKIKFSMKNHLGSRVSYE